MTVGTFTVSHTRGRHAHVVLVFVPADGARVEACEVAGLSHTHAHAAAYETYPKREELLECVGRVYADGRGRVAREIVRLGDVSFFH